MTERGPLCSWLCSQINVKCCNKNSRDPTQFTGNIHIFLPWRSSHQKNYGKYYQVTPGRLGVRNHVRGIVQPRADSVDGQVQLGLEVSRCFFVRGAHKKLVVHPLHVLLLL